jgi:tetratricopeptide (TPR) repeat protein
MATIGLVMIVKNEAAVIGRCLDSVRPLIDCAVIADTGSTDGTQQIVSQWLSAHSVPGRIVEQPWHDFAHNRNEALAALRAMFEVDYAITLDADEYLVFEPNFSPAASRAVLAAADVLRVMAHAGETHYRRHQVFSLRLPFSYRYALHEKLVIPAGSRVAHADGFYNQTTREGARSRNVRKYLDDAAVLENALSETTDPDGIAHYTFYLAQSYRDAGDPQRARDYYLKRSAMDGETSEAGMSLHYAATAMERLGEEPERIIATYLQANRMLPERAEPLCGAARVCRKAALYERGYHNATVGLALAKPEGLFVDSSVYAWRLLDEFHQLAYWTGRFGEAVEAAEQLVSEARFPEAQRQRIEGNALLALRSFEAMGRVGRAVRGREQRCSQDLLQGHENLFTPADRPPSTRR